MARWIAAVALVALAMPATAQQRKPANGTAEPLRELQACRQVPDSAARLACFDGASDRLAEAVARKDVVVLDQQEIKETRRSLFGFSLPRLPLFRGDKVEDQDEVTATIARATSLGVGKWQIRLEDGAVWQTTESIGFRRDPKAGQQVVIKRGSLGAYFLRFNGQTGVRGMRMS